MLLCIACSTGLDHIPSFSEKPLQPPISFQCGHAVCANCFTKRRSLAQSCILCSSARDVLAGPSNSTPSSSRSRGDQIHPPQYSTHETEKPEAADFVLGEDEDEDSISSDKLPDRPPSPSTELPPAYSSETGPKLVKTEKERQQCSIHYLRPEETLLGLSFYYKLDAAELCALNKLPISTISTTPHLLHTLPFLLLPPHANSSSTKPILSPAEERRRLIIRRFQSHTRCSDYSMACAYVQQIFDQREKEANFIRENRAGRGESAESEQVALRQGGELEEAIESWLRDEEWEKTQLGKGKISGSKIKSTGKVEAKIRGWSWPK